MKSEQLKQKSYFTVKEKEINKNIDKSYLAVFKALYWITKEEVANLKSKSLLSLLEELGVKEIESFSTRSEKILRGLIVSIGFVSTVSILSKRKLLKVSNNQRILQS